MPPGQVAPNGGTRSQGGADQIGCERADCDINNAASIKEARVDHIEGGACVTILISASYDVSAGLQHKTAGAEEAPHRN